MDAKHRAVQLLGTLAILLAAVYAFYVLAGFISEDLSDIWLLITHLLNVAVAAYLVWAGVRMLRWAKGLPSLQAGRVKWGRVLLGALFAFYAAKAQLHPPDSAADVDIPLNKVQGQATVAIYIAVVFLGVALAVSGLLAKYKRHAPPEVGPRRPGVSWP